MTMIPANLDMVRQRIRTACAHYGRDPKSVTLLAVSKTHGSDAVEVAYQAGQTAFGENYVQEAVAKVSALRHLTLQWHCIGPIQSNKTRLVAEHFDWIHTVDRLKIAQRLSEQRPASMAPLQVCIQVNVDGGATKSGVAQSDAMALAQAVKQLPNLKLRGLMCIPEPAAEFVVSCAVFKRVVDLFSLLNAKGLELDTLSMGMSADLEAAIASGSTIVRVGSAIFGERSYPASADRQS
jgi:pyridoxal phosphate enzyme (YggS family)